MDEDCGSNKGIKNDLEDVGKKREIGGIIGLNVFLFFRRGWLFGIFEILEKRF